jgi:hypothetical protein
MDQIEQRWPKVTQRTSSSYKQFFPKDLVTFFSTAKSGWSIPSLFANVQGWQVRSDVEGPRRYGQLRPVNPFFQKDSIMRVDWSLYMTLKHLRNYRWNTSGSLLWGMPKVVDESVEVHMRELDGDIERKRQWLGRFRPSAWHNTIRLVSLWVVLWEMGWK